MPELKVSVVVPVYNAGKYLELCAPSLLQQSLSPAAYEVVYVNDGSTDDSEQRLAEICREYPNARFLSQPNSGWPGKPRNVGIEAARGRYVQFVDQDDELAPEALERMYEVGARNDSDIVLGKMGGAMARPNTVFSRNVESGSVTEVGAVDTLTGHKMFRKAFLNQHGIRFPEGYWRMEDLLFVTRAYVHQPRISVVADYVCYWWRQRDDGGNHSLAAFDLADHYRRLRVILATVVDQLPEGELQEELLRRFYRTETLSRVGDGPILEDPTGPWLEALPLLAAVARDSFPPAVRDGLPPVRRLRGLLAEAEDIDGLVEFSRRMVTLVPALDRRAFSIADDGSVQVELGFRQTVPDESGTGTRPLSVVRDDDAWRLDPELLAGVPVARTLDIGDPLRDADGIIMLENPDQEVWWYPEGHLRPELVPTGDGFQVVVTGTLRLDPATAAGGGPLPAGSYSVWVLGQLLGTMRRRRLVVPKGARRQTPTWAFCPSAPIVSRPDWSGPGARLVLEVRDRQEWLAEHLRAGPDRDDPHDRLDLAVLVEGRLPEQPLTVHLSVADQRITGLLRPGPSHGQGWLRLPEHSRLPDGVHPLLVAGAFTFLGEVRTSGGRLETVVAGGPQTLVEAAPKQRPPAKVTPRRLAGRVLRRLGLRD